MPDLHDLLDGLAAGYEPPEDPLARMRERGRQHERTRRVTTALVVVAVAAVAVAGLARLLPRSTVVFDRAPDTSVDQPATTSWSGPVRPDAASMAVITLTEGDGSWDEPWSWEDPDDTAVPWVDITAVSAETEAWRIVLSGWPAQDDAIPDGAILSYGMVVDDGDGVADYVLGIDQREFGGPLRVWITYLATGVTREKTGPPYGDPFDFGHPFERPRGEWPEDAPVPAAPGLRLSGISGAPPAAFAARVSRFYAWASLTVAGNVVAWDYAPDASWLTVAPFGFPKSGRVEPGTYRFLPSAWSVAGFTMTMPHGWEARGGAPGAVENAGQLGELGFYFVTVDGIYADPCEAGPTPYEYDTAGAGELIEIGPSVDDLANALLEQPVTVASGPVDTTLGGLPAKRIDLTLPDDLDPAACPSLFVPPDDVPQRLVWGERLSIWYSPSAAKCTATGSPRCDPEYLTLLGDGTASVYILDVKGQRQVFVTQYRAGTSDDDIREMQAIIDSIEFDP